MYRWEKLLVDTSRGTLEVFTKGEGEPICVTHNYSEFNDSGDYFADAFTKTHKVLLVNLREAGNSAKAVEPYQLSMLETVFDLEAIREALGFEKWAFAGHSTGGMLGLVYGIYFSDSLNFNVIVGAAARDYFTFSADCIYNRNHPKYKRMQELIEALKNKALTAEERQELATKRTKLSLFEPERYREYFSSASNKQIATARMNYFNREIQIFDLTKKLKLISSPTLIICGKYDVQCPLVYSIEMNEMIPNSQLVIFDKSNHYPFLEESERFDEVFTEFLTVGMDGEMF